MGNKIGRLKLCFSCDAGEISLRRHEIAVCLSDEGFGHSFCYFPPESSGLISSFPDHPIAKTAAFKSISGASLSANVSTPLSTAPVNLSSGSSCSSSDKASSFESSNSFASIPLQPIPRNSGSSFYSGPISGDFGVVSVMGLVERGFLSGPIERSCFSDPFDGPFDQFQGIKPKTKKWPLLRNLKKAITNSIVVPIRAAKESDWTNGSDKSSGNNRLKLNFSTNLSSQGSLTDDIDHEPFAGQKVEWAQGKAGEDRVHVVVSEEHEWVFVGIYDGFNGPDATDFLLTNLYSNVHEELKGLLWNEEFESLAKSNLKQDLVAQNDNLKQSVGQDNCPCGNRRSKSDSDPKSKRRKKSKDGTKNKGDHDGNPREDSRSIGTPGVSHSEVLGALSNALRKTEESYLQISDMMLAENPELSLMGSCVLAMLMKGEDVYLMNVGDSRAVLARRGVGIGKERKDLGRIKEETSDELDHELESFPNLFALQLTMDHSTSVEEEVKRIKKEHQDDASAVRNDRVKGSLKVTRAFGAGFLKRPKWNNALLEMFSIDYVGSSPYINCLPSLYHHRLCPRDRFLILSSDGLYQYFTNEEAISEVERFVSLFPEGDPAQHLVEEILFRAAKKAGMDFHELLDIPQGDRRRYHDDVTIIIISFEGRIWRSAL